MSEQNRIIGGGSTADDPEFDIDSIDAAIAAVADRWEDRRSKQYPQMPPFVPRSLPPPEMVEFLEEVKEAFKSSTKQHPSLEIVGAGRISGIPDGVEVEGFTRICEDSVVEAVRADLIARHMVGMAKYGVALDKANLTHRDWLQLAYEETLDKANYLKGAIMDLDAGKVLK